MLEELSECLAPCLWSSTTDRLSQLTTSLHEQQNRSLFELTLNSPANSETKAFAFTCLTLKLLAFDKIKCASFSKYSVVISQREREREIMNEC